ncbi:hypothetical protein ACE1B6_27525 [Aerosakkonemataceae cyanobacterium BLCC-F154]|uniref:Restriction endonuclease domain-containing protein n=1 Tax=Floridaenema fluviatile BLCC-F154 TaxID=3153640 RepID=A0ABV4YJM0_9CYAN
MNRLGIYTALGVPEIWRYDDGRLVILHLEDGEYRECDRSPSLPQLTSAIINKNLSPRRWT